ncbi:mRNA turnover protein 4 homolog [Styela clava]|uniref:mRNA turnover protein 4 homolog n=1 Tax=Styela clava TaxID=7725 RepID=UPI00193A937F|nr:mRNA turnover protein 4 homolog [Styela clava]
MPKSKRDKRVSLTKTRKKGLEGKQNLVEEVRKCVDMYERIFVFSVHNMRNSKLKDVRNAWKHSRFFFGKNKVMMLALGKESGDEYMENIHNISKKLTGEVGILFTSKTKKEVEEWFSSFGEHDFAKSGFKADSTVVLEEGPLNQFSHAIEPHLRKLGLPVALKKGVVTMLEQHKVCKEGEVLSPEQANILKLLKIMMAEFKIQLCYVWDKPTKTFENLQTNVSEKTFNKITMAGEDLKYDFVEDG